MKSIFGEDVDTTSSTYLGKPTSRVDGPAKVTGGAKYAAEFNVPNLLYGYIVSSGEARGTIKSINAAEVEKIPGVVKVLTHENAPKTAYLDRTTATRFRPTAARRSDRSTRRNCNTAFSPSPWSSPTRLRPRATRRHSSKVEYDLAPHETDLRANVDKAHEPTDTRTGYVSAPKKPRGTPDEAFAESPAQSRGGIPARPCRVPHARWRTYASTVRVRRGRQADHLPEDPRACRTARNTCAVSLDCQRKEVQVINPLHGWRFRLRPAPDVRHFISAVLAATIARTHSVRVSMTRQQMFSFSHRPEAMQQIKLAATADGLLDAVSHTAIEETSQSRGIPRNGRQLVGADLHLPERGCWFISW